MRVEQSGGGNFTRLVLLILSTASTSDSETSLLTDDEVSALKYRRMRDLNNEASRRCRDRRRVNQENKEKERVGSVEESTKTTSEATIATVDNMGHRI